VGGLSGGAFKGQALRQAVIRSLSRVDGEQVKDASSLSGPVHTLYLGGGASSPGQFGEGHVGGKGVGSRKTMRLLTADPYLSPEVLAKERLERLSPAALRPAEPLNQELGRALDLFRVGIAAKE
jgi:hypothetical protein